mgnify:CR=1 FL=1
MQERLEVGGNNPPSEIEILKQRLESHVKEEKLINELVAREIHNEITSDENAGEIADHIKSLKSARSSVEKIFKAEKDPFFEACKVADAWKNARWLKIDDCVVKASKPILAWNKKKEDAEKARQLELARLAQEEAERLAKEAEAHADAGIPDTAADLLDFAIEEEKKADILIAKSEDVRGRSYGNLASASSRKVWIGVIEDAAQMDLNLLRKYFLNADIQDAAKRAVNDGVRKLEGVKIFEEDKLTIR